MAQGTERRRRQLEGAPEPSNRTAFEAWLSDRPRAWSITIAARAALRVVPFVVNDHYYSEIVLPLLRAVAIARFASSYVDRGIAGPAEEAMKASTAIAFEPIRSDITDSTIRAAADAAAACSSTTRADAARYAARTVVYATRAADDFGASILEAVVRDAEHLRKKMRPAILAYLPLWEFAELSRHRVVHQHFLSALSGLGRHWTVWQPWCESAFTGATGQAQQEAWQAAFTDVRHRDYPWSEGLPWANGAETVNLAIMSRLEMLGQPATTSEIPDQAPAPVRVEERNGKIAKETDRNSPLGASERDFNAWREPVVDHIGELANGDFRAGTNHGRVRDRLTALEKLLPGEVAEVKERQFRIGYEIERFEGLLAAYRSGGDDMPELNAAQLADLEHLRVALKMGVSKLERWAEFQRQATESPGHEDKANRDAVAESLDQMATAMEQRPQYFHPELPESFRFLAEAARDPRGATHTVVYGAIKSAENLISFLGQRALGIGKVGAEAIEKHISKGVAAMLVTGLGGAALQLSGALPQGWAWLKPLLEAASKAMGAP